MNPSRRIPGDPAAPVRPGTGLPRIRDGSGAGSGTRTGPRSGARSSRGPGQVCGSERTVGRPGRAGGAPYGRMAAPGTGSPGPGVRGRALPRPRSGTSRVSSPAPSPLVQLRAEARGELGSGAKTGSGAGRAPYRQLGPGPDAPGRYPRPGLPLLRSRDLSGGVALRCAALVRLRAGTGAQPPRTAASRTQGSTPQPPHRRIRQARTAASRRTARPGIASSRDGPPGRAVPPQAQPKRRHVQADGPWCPGLAHLCLCGRMLQYAKCAGAVVRPVRTFVLRRTT